MPKTKTIKVNKIKSEFAEILSRNLKRLFRIGIASAIIWFLLGILILLTLYYFISKGNPENEKTINPFAKTQSFQL